MTPAPHTPGYNNNRRHLHLLRLCAAWIKEHDPEVYRRLRDLAEQAWPKMISGAEARRRLQQLAQPNPLTDEIPPPPPESEP